MNMVPRCAYRGMWGVVVFWGCVWGAVAQEEGLGLASTEQAVARVKPALVRIQVVEANYSDGREIKDETSGSGVIITKEGHVVTNHHVAGHAKRLVCTLSTREEVEAELVGTDPMVDVAVIKLKNDGTREYPVASFGDSSRIKVGETVLAMGSPMALSQSVTKGIVSNTEMVMPAMLGPYAEIKLDGEDVGSIVRWIGHDASIYGGNSGGPLVNLDGEIIGINEIRMALAGAIPGNQAKAVAETLIAQGKVKRSWMGMGVQPLLKSDEGRRGVLVNTVIEGGPAAVAGILPGDKVVQIAGKETYARFREEMPAFNQMVCDLPLGEEVEVRVLRGMEERAFRVKTAEREEMLPRESEFKEWGVTVRPISPALALEMKRDNTNGVLVTSVRPGGPAGEAKPQIQGKDVIVEAAGKAVDKVSDLRAITDALVKEQKDPVPTLVGFERRNGKYLTVVKVGIKELEDPGLEVTKAWLPVDAQVITRDMARQLGAPEMTGFRVVQVYPDSTAAQAGLCVGDFILALDGEALTASSPENYEELPTRIRQYKIGSVVELSIQRDGQTQKVPVTLVASPKLSREMRKCRDHNFEFTVRDITFFDKNAQKWAETQQGVMVEEVTPGGWAALGELYVGDLVIEVNGASVMDAASFEKRMKDMERSAPEIVVFRVKRGIHQLYLESEPKWKE
ncbi:MAG TPA: PDZ domain-containing protein [Candidatus Hydrogenedentes bacterium]|nr:PDZ domain-containing protein [Candidatus Hydrogenedentota bacterium]HOS02586.1 PDZ domain-containing protein [Candidatus Hydrogenedentota bacterium]